MHKKGIQKRIGGVFGRYPKTLPQKRRRGRRGHLGDFLNLSAESRRGFAAAMASFSSSSFFDSSFFSNHLHPLRHTSRWTKLGLGASVASIAFAAGVASAPLASPESSGRRGDPVWKQCSGAGGVHGFFPFASVSQSLASSFTEPKTGVSFPTSIVISEAGADDEKISKELNLAGTGLRKKNILGLKNITVYAFGKKVPPLPPKKKSCKKKISLTVFVSFATILC
jgi:hypothetical protein